MSRRVCESRLISYQLGDVKFFCGQLIDATSKLLDVGHYQECMPSATFCTLFIYPSLHQTISNLCITEPIRFCVRVAMIQLNVMERTNNRAPYVQQRI